MVKYHPGDDILFAYREKVWTVFGAICIALFLPSSIFIYVQGYRTLAVAVFCMLFVLAVNSYSTIRNKAPRVSMAVFIFSLMLVTGMSLFQRELYGAFWPFPAVLLISLLTFGRIGTYFTIIYFIYIALILFYVFEIQIAARAVLGLVLTILFINIFLTIIGKLQVKLLEQSNIDPLTGVLNRRQLNTILQEAIERKRRSNTPASLLIFDIDRFKSVNDTYGHSVGDRVLTELASIIKGRARLLDQVFRLGGEEFMLFLPDTDINGAANLAEELRMLVSESKFIEDRVITISIGIGELEHEETIDTWIKRSDDALYMAKDHGRNQIVEALLEEVYV